MNIVLKITDIYSPPNWPARAWRSCRRQRRTFGLKPEQWKRRSEEAGLPHDNSGSGPKLVRKAA